MTDIQNQSDNKSNLSPEIKKLNVCAIIFIIVFGASFWLFKMSLWTYANILVSFVVAGLSSLAAVAWFSPDQKGRLKITLSLLFSAGAFFGLFLICFI